MQRYSINLCEIQMDLRGIKFDRECRMFKIYTIKYVERGPLSRPPSVPFQEISQPSGIGYPQEDMKVSHNISKGHFPPELHFSLHWYNPALKTTYIVTTLSPAGALSSHSATWRNTVQVDKRAVSWSRRRLPQLHNYWPVVPARQKLTRFVRSEGFLLPPGTQPSLAAGGGTKNCDACENRREAVYTL